MSQPAEQFITPADYLALERKAEIKSEYLNGHIYAMSGASRNHNTNPSWHLDGVSSIEVC
jgi:Uma2 family endonuclease